MTHIVKQFNSIVEDLLRQTTHLIGTKYLFNFKTIIQFNAILPMEKFTINMLPYKSYIMAKNTDFFMNAEVDLSGYSEINYNDIIDLKQIFTNIDEESKENIWEILQALVILCEERSISKPSIKSSFW